MDLRYRVIILGNGSCRQTGFRIRSLQESSPAAAQMLPRHGVTVDEPDLQGDIAPAHAWRNHHRDIAALMLATGAGAGVERAYIPTVGLSAVRSVTLPL